MNIIEVFKKLTKSDRVKNVTLLFDNDAPYIPHIRGDYIDSDGKEESDLFTFIGAKWMGIPILFDDEDFKNE